ncbi:MAG TPA: putative Ig domain-containing protein, partial [Blastocatellia bacterium]|nr:putative Ig domain-containing protein [Blastocatellia bacterium]
NNSNGHTVRNNVLTDNRTGMIFRNQTDNLTVVENTITNNWTVGIVFLDGSGGSNTPVQTAANCTFSNNNLSGNWYGQIVDRQSGGSLPTPGTNLKNFSANWFGSTTPLITTANSAEPGYAAQIPSTVPGGSATAPGGQPDIAGPASTNFDITPLLDVATDTNVETVLGRGTFGFQGSYNVLNVITANSQTGAASRIQEGVNLVNTGGTVKTLAGFYTGNADVNKAATLSGAFTTSGTLGASAAGAIISPGFSPGIINSGDLSLAAGTALNIELASSTTPGAGYDQINVIGAVNLGGATLNATLGFAPPNGSSFFIIVNDGSDPVVGTFAGLPQGASLLIGGTPFQISYTGGSGNDVVLTTTCPVITLLPSSLPNGVAGVSYSQSLSAMPSGGGYSFAVTGGSLPAGLTLMPNGTLSGVPLANGSYTFTVTATGFAPYACPGSQIYTLTIGCPTIALTPASLPNGTAGVAYSQAIGATPAGGGYTFAVTTGVLPAGLTLAANGTLAGTPTQSGTFNFRVTTIGFGICTAFQDYQLTIGCTTITLAPGTLPGGTVGTAYNQTVAASPAGSYNYAVTSGALPTGLSLNAGTGAITGAPTTTGSFNFTITASAGACAGSQSYTVTIACPSISLTTASPLPAGQAGVAYSQTLNVTPAGSYTFSLTVGSLPSGLALNPATGTISGIPSTTGTFTFTVKAQTAGNCSGTQSYTLTIGCPTITVNPSSLPNGSTGAAYSQTLSATPVGGSYTFAVTTGSLPTGLNLNSATGLLSGTPTVNGAFNFTVTATGFGGCTGNRAYSITIGAGGCPTITLPASLANGTVGQLYTVSAAASPAGGYSYAVSSGTLPPGTTLYTSFGLIYGFPTAAGSYTFTITATQGACTASQNYTVLISAGFASSLTVASDFDGDGKSDLSVFRADGNWAVANSGNGQAQATLWGAPYAPYNDLTVSGDYDGDGKTDLAVFRRGTEGAGHWFIKRSSDGKAQITFWGLPTDTPVPGDYDGDGKTDIAVWRGSEGVWFVIRSSDGKAAIEFWGLASLGDVAVPGDYDGDFKTDLAIFRRSTGEWYVKRSSDGVGLRVKWGVGTDVPVQGDYDGDGKTDYAVWRASEGNWYIVESGTAKQVTVSLGNSGDLPVVSDYDGDGKADPAIWQSATGGWQIKRSSDGTTQTRALGQSGDLPIPAKRN